MKTISIMITCDFPVSSINVTYQPGTLGTKGFVNGKQTVSEQVETTDCAIKVLLADHSQLNADGEDVAVVTVQLNDLKNRWAPTANKEIVFTLSGQGKIIGVGNGDPAFCFCWVASSREYSEL